MAKKRLREERPKAIWGTVIPALFSTAARIWGSSQAADQQKQALLEQKREVERQARLTNLNNQAQTLNNYFNSVDDEPKYYQYKYGGKKKNRGKFTASAKKAGKSVQEHARDVMKNPNATPLQKRRANFAIQAAK